MKYRKLGKTGFEISEISLGTWQVGGVWGEVFSHENAEKILHAAVDSGINFIDTADVYGDGESEKAVGKFVKNRSERIYVATKCGRQLNPHVNEAYQPAVLRKFVEASLKNMGLETLDLIQLHCPPTQVFYRPEIFELFDRLKEEGKILNLGISVEKVEEALKGIEYDNVTSVQIIFNTFRQRPAELFFEQAKKKNIGVIVRVPLASGLLTGKFSKQSTFTSGDHRNFNRNGEMFDKGETFSGIDYETGLTTVEELKALFPNESNLAPIALKWILQFDAVSTIIPGASRPEQVLSNIASLDYPDLTDAQITEMNKIYSKHIKPLVHHLW
ncbi:aldo/keto reductase [Emticicia oligotrophica DSM 17448]|uniref:Aldo/keto reductase n=1 Tax=Emticicia oligotrophica (strain DSM 17448 / CIP 109782 / MTCC 6937 / GPTSA100-15) TaxID=929562 RepID=A0ABM5N7C2_EMTOG|nr:aldo/keto reductase [Emticicia oligotrophica]AFK05270.1 aldo/keto reductase [Emticicia oligotrophica DSM 17448]